MKEIWKDIPGYEGLYQVSNTGKIRSLPKNIVHRNVKRNNGRVKDEVWWKPGRTLRYLYYTPTYPVVRLYKDTVRKDISVKKIVAQMFIPEYQLDMPASKIHIKDPTLPLSVDNLEVR